MQRHHKKTFFLLTLIILAFAAFFLFLYYTSKHKTFIPSPPAADYIITADNSPGPNAWLYSFEKGGPPDLRSDKKSHSGKYSTLAKGRLSFSMVIKKTVAECDLSCPSRIACSAWLFIADARSEPDASLVIMIRNKKGHELFSSAITIRGNDVPQNKWFKISGSFELKAITLSPDDVVSVFLWNNSSCDIYMDDLLTVFGMQKMSFTISKQDNSCGKL